MSPFQSPNYTQTPNDLFDELLPDMGLAELKVMLCIVRHTFGYHRDEVKLSIRAIARFTGLTVRSVLEGAKQAEDHGLVERYADGGKTTMWRAMVTVLPSSTPRNTRYNRRVLPATTQLGDKERKKESKENEDEGRSPQSLFIIYQNEIGLITPFIADAIEGWLKDGLPEKWIADGIHEAAAQNKRSWKYVEAILKRWDAQGNQNPVEKPVKQNGRAQAVTRQDQNQAAIASWLAKKQAANNG
jgi:DnaD/phage-associated family protein